MNYLTGANQMCDIRPENIPYPQVPSAELQPQLQGQLLLQVKKKSSYKRLGGSLWIAKQHSDF